MKRKNGFTLIELLAIIVILAIIAVITVPIILGIIDDAQVNAAKDSAYGFKDSVNKYYAQQLLSNQSLKLNDTYTVTNGTLSDGDFGDSNIKSLPIQVSGKVPTSGTLTYSNNVLTSGCLVIGDYAVTFSGENVTNTTKGVCSSAYVYISSDIDIEFDDTSFKIWDSNEEDYVEIDNIASSYGSSTRPTDVNTYLKIASPNGEVVPGTKPEACIYDEIYGELCLKNNEFETSVQKIKTYFKWNEDTSSSDYENVTCDIDSLSVGCSDGLTVGAYAGRWSDPEETGYVEVANATENYGCIIHVYDNAVWYKTTISIFQ